MQNNVPQVGQKAPDFSLPGLDGKTVKLSDYLGKKNVILSFHPLAWTGICANQMKDLQDEYANFVTQDTVALGISVDSVPSKTAWAESLKVTDVELLADFEPKGAVAKLYGIYNDENGFSERAVFVVDKKGDIVFSRVYPIKQKPDLVEILPVIEMSNS